MEMWNGDMYNGAGQPLKKVYNFDWSHGWAASPAYIIPWFLFGVRPTSPAFAAVSIRPQPGGLANGSLTMSTVRGPIRVAFDHKSPTTEGSSGAFAMRIELPAGCVASVGLPLFAREGAAAQPSSQVVVDGTEVAAKTSPGGGFAEIGNVGPGGSHTFVLATHRSKLPVTSVGWVARRGLKTDDDTLLPGAPLQKALQAAADAHALSFTIAPGEYNFSTVALRLSGALNLAIHAHGVTLWFRAGGGCNSIAAKACQSTGYSLTTHRHSPKESSQLWI